MVYSICAQCRNLYCHTCSDAHFNNNPNHDLCGIEPPNAYLSDQIKCNECNTADACTMCVICKNVFCQRCTCMHAKSNLKQLTRNMKTGMHKTYEQCTFPVRYLKSINITQSVSDHNISICGIASLPKFVVLADSHNRILIVFQNEKFIFKASLNGREPRGITSLGENKIALTMPYDNEILFYNINDTGAEHYQTKNLLPEYEGKWIGRPFKIAYDSNHLAIETGLGDNGVILITDEECSIKHMLTNEQNWGYFTGNTIRFALDWNRKQLFVSAMSKKAISCLDFEGHIIWNMTVSSPRDVVTIEHETNQHLLLISKHTEAIYIFDAKNGSREKLFYGGRLKKPRFMAYNSSQKIIYVNQDHTILLFQLV